MAHVAGINEQAWAGGFRRVKGDESLGWTLALATDTTTKQLHVCDIADAKTDWALAVSTDPTVYIHSATTPATNYISMSHDGTTGNITPGGAAGKLAVAATWSTAGTLGRPFLVQLTIDDVRLGSYANAFKAYVDCGASGGSQGVLSAANCEIDMPTTSGGEGVYCCNEHELVFPEGYNASGCTVSFAYYNTAGNDVADFDTTGYFFHIGTGMTEAAGSIVSANQQTLKVGIGGITPTARYLVMSVAENGLSLTNTDAAGGGLGVKVVQTLTSTGAVASRAIDGQIVYTPTTAGSGGSVPIAVAGKVTLTTGITSTLYMWGVQGQVQFDNTSVLNGSQVAAVRAVLTNTGSSTWTGGNIACLYCDNLIDDDISGVDSHIARLANHGGAIDSIISVYPANVTNLFNFEVGGAWITDITGGGVHGGTIYRLKCSYMGTTVYLIASTAPTS